MMCVRLRLHSWAAEETSPFNPCRQPRCQHVDRDARNVEEGWMGIMALSHVPPMTGLAYFHIMGVVFVERWSPRHLSPPRKEPT